MEHATVPRAPLHIYAQSVLIFAWLLLRGLAIEVWRRARAALSGNVRSDAHEALTFELLWRLYVYGRFAACWRHTVTSNAGALIDVDGSCGLINLGSYNYLGLECGDSQEHQSALDALYGADCGDGNKTPDSASSSRRERDALESDVAAFVRAEDACVFASGFSANAMAMAALVPRDAIVIADELVHASLLAGRRISGATLRRYRHNDMEDLERQLTQAHTDAWLIDLVWRTAFLRDTARQIWVVTEGVFSMEGTTAPLRAIMALRTGHDFRLWLDEAHSVGALGAHGRGLHEHCGLAIGERDIVVGTFSKALAACGGYVAGSRAAVESVRLACAARPVMNALLAAHVRAGLRLLASDAGAARVAALQSNARYLRAALLQCGLRVLGHDANGDGAGAGKGCGVPVVPLLVYHPLKLVAFQQRLAERGVAVVVVGFPACPVFSCRARLCVSAAHDRVDLVRAACKIVEVARELGIIYE